MRLTEVCPYQTKLIGLLTNVFADSTVQLSVIKSAKKRDKKGGRRTNRQADREMELLKKDVRNENGQKENGQPYKQTVIQLDKTIARAGDRMNGR